MSQLIRYAKERTLLLWAGVVVFAFGLALDLAVHGLLSGGPFPLLAHHSPVENLAHFIPLAGVLLVLAGVLTLLRRRLSGSLAGRPPGKGS